MNYSSSSAIKSNQGGQAVRLLTMLFSLMMSLSLTACTGTKDVFAPVRTSVIKVDQFGDIVLNLKDINLEYGDSVNVSFSGGYEKKGRYKKEYEAYNISDGRIRMEGQSDEEFRNTREITAGQIKEKCLYRGSSPFDPEYNRVQLMGQYIQDNRIKCILDLTDSQEKLDAYKNLPDYTASMISNHQVIPCAIGVDYVAPESMQAVGRAFVEMTEKEGPYLIQCSFGRDRTGVISAVLEALCGATYQEIIEDYMISYHLLHDINMDPESLQYKLFKQRIDELLGVILDIDIEKLPVSDLQTPASEYLMRCGMTKEQVERLKDRLTK